MPAGARSQQVLAAVLEHLSDGFLFTDPYGQVMLINHALEQMLGRPAATLLGKPLPADLAPGIGPIIGQALETSPEPARGEILLGDGRCIQANASAMEGETGTVVGVMTTLRDVSRRRAAERVKEAVLTAISHEFRTPLASIVGFAALAEKTLHDRLVPNVSAEDSKVHRAVVRIADQLRRIDESGQQLEQMVSDLLDLADMEAGRLEWHMGDVNLVDAIHVALSAIESQAEDKGLSIRLSLPPDLPLARGDRARLAQAVTNLLSNAVKFTDRGEVRVSAGTLRVDEGEAPDVPVLLLPGDYLLVSVSDTGRGIPAESLPRLFEKFFQSETSLTDRPAGAGLGLAVCREIVEHHGGHIWAESEPEVGSTFSFTLPLDAQARPAQPILLRELRRRLAAALPEWPEPQTILVASADADLQRLLGEGLTPDDFTLFWASGGEACRRVLRSETPSLLVLDLLLPALDALHGLPLPPALLLAVVEAGDDGLRVALGEALPGLAGVSLALRSLPSHLAAAWDEGSENRLLILDASAPSLGGITETLDAQDFEPVVSPRPADANDPDQAILEAALALLRPARVQSTTHYRNPQRDLCTVVLVEF
jgi:PAS domain S-box-containing protein